MVKKLLIFKITKKRFNMIEKLKNLPESVLGFTIHHRITKSDFKKLIMPEVSQGIEKNPKLDFLYVIDNETDTSFSVWFEDAIRKVQNICSWNKTAFITDCEGMSKPVSNFQKFMKGDFNQKFSSGWKTEVFPTQFYWICGFPTKTEEIFARG